MNTLHLVVTNLCDRNCKYCCNKKYDIPQLPYATDENFKWADMLCLTGGEPFEYANPCNLAKKYRKQYKNLKAIIVYTNAKELADYLDNGGTIHDIDGVNISVKDIDDLTAFLNPIICTPEIQALRMNRIYDFTGKISPIDFPDFNIILREWQKDFIPAKNCLFMRGN